MSCNVGSAIKSKATGEARGLKEKKKKTKMGFFSPFRENSEEETQDSLNWRAPGLVSSPES